MENVSEKERIESVKSFQSTIRKLEKALAQMTEKGANTTLIRKRLRALHIGLAVLEDVWNGKSHAYAPEELGEARQVLEGLFPSLENMELKLKQGSPQRTLLDRRMRSLELAMEAIDDLLRSV